MTAHIAGISQLGELLATHRPALILTGAGISTDSGIPAYRDEDGNWIHSKPVQAADFYNKEDIRKRYWLRSMLGWQRIHSAKPNDTHHMITLLEKKRLTQCIITQNVDNLHQRADSRHVVDLHGNLQSVICLQCSSRVSRQVVQTMLQSANSQIEVHGTTIGPDGDAAATNLDELLTTFKVADCPDCGGTLKPDVVFFGENVPTERVEYCMNQLKRSSMLICLGTSLTVFSGYRFCRAAKQLSIPIVLVNQGTTRADDLADCIVNANCSAALLQLREQL